MRPPEGVFEKVEKSGRKTKKWLDTPAHGNYYMMLAAD
jgi:hypothetical protein